MKPLVNVWYLLSSRVAITAFQFIFVTALLTTPLAVAQTAEQLLTGQSPNSPRATECFQYDQEFVSGFEIGSISLALLGALIIPFVLPFTLSGKWWWLTRPIFRYVVITIFWCFVALILLVALPTLAVNNRIPTAIGISWTNASYSQCIGQSFETTPLFGLIRRPAIDSWPELTLGYIGVYALFSLIYWLTHLALIRRAARGNLR